MGRVYRAAPGEPLVNPLRVLLAAIGLALAGCGAVQEDVREAGGDAGAPRGGITLAEARAFSEFPLVYAGESVLGYPLGAILRREDTVRYVSFIYGDCEPAALEGGCAPPIEIQVWPSGARNLGSYGETAPRSAWGSPALEPTTVRGLPAAYVGDDQLELYAGTSTVVVFSASRARGLAVAARLRCLREDARAPPARLAC